MSTTLNHWRDGASCFSNITLGDGTPILVSVAQSGVKIKKTRFGFFGKTLLSAGKSDIHIFDSVLAKYKLTEKLPLGVNNIVLKAFTAMVLECENHQQLEAEISALLG